MGRLNPVRLAYYLHSVPDLRDGESPAMKKFACDICGEEFQDEYKLSTLGRKYSFEGVEHVCESCCNQINKAFHRLEKHIRRAIEEQEQTLLRRIVARLKGR